jgi:hypothetical protein
MRRFPGTKQSVWVASWVLIYQRVMRWTEHHQVAQRADVAIWLTERADLRERREDRIEMVEWAVRSSSRSESLRMEWWHKFLPHFPPSLRLKPARMKSAFKRGPLLRTADHEEPSRFELRHQEIPA